MQKVMEDCGALSRLSTLIGSQTGRDRKTGSEEQKHLGSQVGKIRYLSQEHCEGTENILALSHTLILKDVSGNSVES